MCECPFQGHLVSLCVRAPCLPLPGAVWLRLAAGCQSRFLDTGLGCPRLHGCWEVHPGHCPTLTIAHTRPWEALQKGDSPGPSSPREHLDSDLLLNPKQVSYSSGNSLWGPAVPLRWLLPGGAVSKHIHHQPRQLERSGLLASAGPGVCTFIQSPMPLNTRFGTSLSSMSESTKTEKLRTSFCPLDWCL